MIISCWEQMFCSRSRSMQQLLYRSNITVYRISSAYSSYFSRIPQIKLFGRLNGLGLRKKFCYRSWTSKKKEITEVVCQPNTEKTLIKGHVPKHILAQMFKIYSSNLDSDKNMIKYTTSTNVSIYLSMYLVSNWNWHTCPMALLTFLIWGVRLLTEEESSVFRNTLFAFLGADLSE